MNAARIAKIIFEPNIEPAFTFKHHVEGQKRLRLCAQPVRPARRRIDEMGFRLERHTQLNFQAVALMRHCLGLGG